MAVSLRQIRAFLAVAEHGAFTRAAERLKVAQPALSALVRELEREVGLRLFDRTTRRVELTEGGREFRAAAETIVRDLDAAVRDAADRGKRRRGRVVVAAPPMLAAAALPAAILDMADRHPGLEVAVVDVGVEAILEALRAGRADCGVGTFLDGEGLERRRLTRDRLMLFSAAGSAFARRASLAWADLAGAPIIALTRESGLRRLVDFGFESARMALAPRYEVAQIATALALVEAGLGVAPLPAYAMAAATHRAVAATALVAPTIGRDISLIRLAGRSASPAMSAFEASLRRALRSLAPVIARGAAS
ncbi:MAG: LysR family transcriptional regulator [Methylobacteriaceae bacterium]|nr:LysR family transcriptional regulator [Methylobacteriaceae bacterium]